MHFVLHKEIYKMFKKLNAVFAHYVPICIYYYKDTSFGAQQT